MEKNIYSILAVFPTPNIEETAKYYNEVLGFRVVKYLDVKEPHVCLYRSEVEVVLLKAKSIKSIQTGSFTDMERMLILLLTIRNHYKMNLLSKAQKLFAHYT